jgi:hypothetical protein
VEAARGRALAVGALLVVLALAARVPGAVGDALWQDEIGAARVISEPAPGSAIDRIVARESTPPAYYALAWGLDKGAEAAGLEPVQRARGLRTLSIAFAIGCTALTFVLALSLLPLWAAALAGLLTVFAAPLVLHGYELRAYSLLAFASVGFAVALERAAARPAYGRLALLAGATALGALTHYFFLTALAAGILWLLVSVRSRAVAARVGAALAIGLVPLAAWLPYFLRQYEHGVYGTARPFSVWRFLDFLPSLFVPQPVIIDVGVAVSAVLALPVLASAALLLRRPEGRLCALFVLVPFLGVSVLATLTEERVFNTRNLIGIAPFAAVALAWGCASLPWRRVSYAAGALAVVLVCAGFAWGEVGLGRTPYDRIAGELLAQGLRHDEPIVWFGNYDGIVPVSWYLTGKRRADAWPRVVLAEPTKGTCTGVAIVARSEEGRQWLRAHRDAIVARATIPYFGDDLQGSRRPDLVVARARWSPGLLDRPAGAENWFLLRLAGSHSPCLRRKAA